MIAPQDRILRALGVLEERGQAWAAHPRYERIDRGPFIEYDEPIVRRNYDRHRISLDVELVGALDDIPMPSTEEKLIAAARAHLPKDLNDDELYERAATWFAERMHRPNKVRP